MVDDIPTIESLMAIYDLLPAEQKAELDELLVSDKAATPWRPMLKKDDLLTDTPQQQAYHSLADILLYGGSAGGGKTALVAGLAMMAHKRSTIFRREINQLSPIIDEILGIHGTRKGYNSQKNILSLPGNRSIRFGGMQYETDKQAFQGDARDLMAFDEVTQFLESQVRYVLTWNRAISQFEGQRCRVVMASNPPTTNDGDWVIAYFAPWLDPKHPHPALPGELRWFISDKDGKDQEVDGPQHIWSDELGEFLEPRSRTFIPSSVDDNVYLENSGYKAGLQALPEPLRSQMLRGDFLAGRDDDPWQVIPTKWVEAAQERWEERKPANLPMTAVGYDAARGGKDIAVLARRHGWWFDTLITAKGAEVPDGGTGAAFVIQHTKDGAAIMLDVIGAAGASVFDQLVTNGVNVEPVDGRRESHERDLSGSLGFFNTRSRNYWRLREALDPENGEDLALPPDRELLADLTAPRWKVTGRGIQVEGKSTETKDGFGDLKARLGRSTDKGDAVVMALQEPKRRPGLGKRGNRRPGKTNNKYNPHKPSRAGRK